MKKRFTDEQIESISNKLGLICEALGKERPAPTGAYLITARDVKEELKKLLSLLRDRRRRLEIVHGEYDLVVYYEKASGDECIGLFLTRFWTWDKEKVEIS